MPEFANGAAHLFYEDLGAGPAVLFSHSWLCDGRQWPQTSTVAEAGYRVLNLDNRGHRRSGPHHQRFTMWEMADDLVAVLDDAGVDDAVVVGLSMAGSQPYARRYDTRVGCGDSSSPTHLPGEPPGRVGPRSLLWVRYGVRPPGALSCRSW